MPLGFHSIGLFILLVLFIGTIFWLWMLIDCAINQKLSLGQKLLWILAIIFTHPIGPLLYFFLGRSPKQPQTFYQPYSYRQGAPPQTPPVAYSPYQQGYQPAPPNPPRYQAENTPPTQPYEQQSSFDYEQPQAMYPHDTEQ